jgi:hypothetical protein
MVIRRMSSQSNSNGNADSTLEAANGVAPKRGMVLPFTPLAMSFDSVNYYVDMPAVRIHFPSSIHLLPKKIICIHIYYSNIKRCL